MGLRARQSQIQWPEENDSERQARRERLTSLDGLLWHIEQHNLRHEGEPLSRFVMAWYCRLGGRRFAPYDVVTGAELHEAVLDLQEAAIRTPEPTGD